MEKNHFSEKFFDEIKRTVEETMKKSEGPYYAAFDADGTLWDSDLGEQFFQYQIDHCDLEPLKKVNPWEYYETTKKTDPVAAYLWLAQINAGHSLEQVRAWSKACIEKNGARVFESQKKLIAWLQSMGVETLIVTASIQWAVEPAGELAGISYENVMGIQTATDENGIVTEEQFGPITWREGKAKALLSRTDGVKPVLCAGNTYGDIALLEASKGARICSQTQTEKNGLEWEESKLLEHAKKHNWPVHHFFDPHFTTG